MDYVTKQGSNTENNVEGMQMVKSVNFHDFFL